MIQRVPLVVHCDVKQKEREIGFHGEPPSALGAQKTRPGAPRWQPMTTKHMSPPLDPHPGGTSSVGKTVLHKDHFLRKYEDTP